MFRKAKSKIKQIKTAFQCYNKQKVYCIGKNKTGTTSLKTLFTELGYKVAPQGRGEYLADDWIRGDYKKILRFAKYGGQVFQDVPFSLPDTYKYLDKKYSDSKFILTIRDDANTWYNSLISFHAKKFGGGNIPSPEQLKQVSYRGKRWAWRLFRALHDTPIDDIYNKEILMADYTQYNEEVIEYFSSSPKKLLVINLKDEGVTKKLSQFLGSSIDIAHVPWENKTSEIKD